MPLVVAWPGQVKPGLDLFDAGVQYRLLPDHMVEMAAQAPKGHVTRSAADWAAPLLREIGVIDRKSLFNFFPHTAGD